MEDVSDLLERWIQLEEGALSPGSAEELTETEDATPKNNWHRALTRLAPLSALNVLAPSFTPAFTGAACDSNHASTLSSRPLHESTVASEAFPDTADMLGTCLLYSSYLCCCTARSLAAPFAAQHPLLPDQGAGAEHAGTSFCDTDELLCTES